MINLAAIKWTISFACLALAASASSQSRHEHDRELMSVTEMIGDPIFSSERWEGTPLPPRDEIFHALTDNVSRTSALTSLDMNDVNLSELRHTQKGMKISGILNDTGVESVQFVSLDPHSLLMMDELGDAPMLGDTQAFLGVSVHNLIARHFSDTRVQWLASLNVDDGEGIGEVALMIVEQSATGFIRKGVDVYEVTPVGDGLHALTLRSDDLPERNSDDFEMLARPEPDPNFRAPAATDHLGDTEVTNGDNATAADGRPSECAAELEGRVTIEVVAGYTAEARDKALEHGKDVENLILSASVLGNTAFINSDINVELSVLNMILLPDYQEGAASMRKETSDLVNAVPALAPLLQARKDNSADVAVLVVNREDLGNCGRAAGIRVDAERALAVANWRCMNENFSYAHEIGHLAGAWHNPEVLANTGPKDPPYAHGFAVATDRPFVTVMGYPSTCVPKRCPRVWNWSNPNATTFFGAVTGTNETHNNACLWRERAAELAAFGHQL